MNGDLSLSKSLGGLRIANPDDDDNSSNPSRSPEAASPQPGTSSYPLTQSSMNAPDNHASAAPGSGGLDVDALGFDPTSYAGDGQPLPSQYYLAPPSGEHVQRYNLAATASDLQSSNYYAPARSYHPHSTRPTSGAYYPNTLSSTPASFAESPYQRVRAESTQSAAAALSTPPHRSHSKPGYGETSSARIPNGRSYRQHSSSSPQPATAGYAGRQISKSTSPQDQPSQDLPHGQVSSTQQRSVGYSSESSQGTPSGTNSRDKGPASGGGQKSTESDGSKQGPKTVKKGVKDFNFGRTLGEGSYSTVLAATDRTTMKEYAIKVLDKRHIIKERKVKYVNIERDTLNRLTEHPGIVRLYYTFQDERSLYFVLDLATGGELLGVLKKMTSFDEECAQFYSAQILDAIEYMHKQGIIHRDLKPENVLLDDQMHVKITDFGTAKILDLSGTAQFGKVSVTNDPMDGADTDRAVSFVGTAEYVSPELLTDKNACKASDLWAFGCIVYQLLAGRPPFKAVNEYQTFQKIVHLDYSFPEGFPSLARDLVSKLLVLAPGDRIAVDAIKQHPFFEGIHWGKGLWKQKAPKLRSYNPLTSQDARTWEQGRDVSGPTYNSLPPRSKTPQPGGGHSGSTPPRPQPRVITELAPPSQLDIDWSPVLTKANERIIKLGQLVVYSMPAPHSPTSKSSAGGETTAEIPSKFSRFFGGSGTKKRQRLVMITSGARLVLAPSGGDRKEAKQIVNLTDPDVSWKSQQDAKGYTVWCVFTKHTLLTFEDTKANTGDAGSSMRSTQEWLDKMQEVKGFGFSRRQTDPFPEESMNGLGSSMSNPGIAADGSEAVRPEVTSAQGHRKILRKDAAPDDDSMKGRKRFSRRHSKNGLAAVF